MKNNKFLFVSAWLCLCASPTTDLWASLPVCETSFHAGQTIQRVMPEAGKMYRIAAVTRDHKYYLTADEQEGLKTSTEINHRYNQVWKCSRNVDGTFCFRLVHTDSYLAFRKISTAAEAFELDPAQAVTEGGLPLRAPRLPSSYMLVKNDNGAFDQSSVKWDKDQNYSSDYVFEEVSELPAQPVLQVDLTRGNKNGDSYFDTWTSNGGVAVVLKNTYKNMAWNNGQLHLYKGKNQAPYILQAPQGMVLEGYTLVFGNANGAAMTVTPEGGEAVTCATEAAEATLQVRDVMKPQVKFEVSAAGNTALKVIRFEVSLKYAEDYAPQEPIQEEYGTLLFEGVDAPHPYRIPALTTTRSGRVLAFSDWRPCHNDIGYGEVDIQLRTSDDNGKTWKPAKTILDGTPDYGYGDAAVVADRTSDEVLLMAAAGKVVFLHSTREKPIPVARAVSHDGGLSWSAPEEVTEKIYGALPDDVVGVFFTSGRVIQSSVIRKDRYYRLYAAVVVKQAQGAFQNYVLYSDDFGANWQVLGNQVAIAGGANEAKCEELPDGTVLLASRKGGGRIFNVFTYAPDRQTGTWGTAVHSDAVEGGLSYGANACNGEMLLVPAVKRATGEKTQVLLLSVPTGKERSNLAFYYKEVGPQGMTPMELATGWSAPQLVTPVYSGYSALTLQRDGSIGLFLEDTMFGQRSYNMNYRNFTLDAITRGAYEVDRSLEISAGREFVPVYNGVYDVTLNKKLQAGWNAVCLPFALKADRLCEGAEAQEFVSYRADGLHFARVEQMEAGKPYLVHCPTEVTEPVALKGMVLEAGAPQTVCPQGSPLLFQGTYRPAAQEGCLVVSSDGDGEVLTESEAPLPVAGAFFWAERPEEVEGKNLFFEGGPVTSVESVDRLPLTFDVYSITGVCVQKNVSSCEGLPRGIYVVAGKKVVVK